LNLKWKNLTFYETFRNFSENVQEISRKHPEGFLKIPEIYMVTLDFISQKFPSLLGCGLVPALLVTEIS
jgi:hypothetical protein